MRDELKTLKKIQTLLDDEVPEATGQLSLLTLMVSSMCLAHVVYLRDRPSDPVEAAKKVHRLIGEGSLKTLIKAAEEPTYQAIIKGLDAVDAGAEETSELAKLLKLLGDVL